MARAWGTGAGERLTGATSILTLGVGLLALFLGFDWFWMVFVLGWAVATPLVAILSGSRRSEDDARTGADAIRESSHGASTTGAKEDALETLRTRYARGELSDVEFERKLEKLLETETLEDIRRAVASETARVPETEQEQEPSEELER